MKGDNNAAPDALLKQTFFTRDDTSKKHDQFEKQLNKMLDADTKTKDIFAYLKSLSPSGVELEFLTLANFEFGDADPNDNVSNTHLLTNVQITKMLRHFSAAIKTMSDFDFLQALLNNFLKNHAETLMSDAQLSEALRDVSRQLKDKYADLERLFDSNVSMTGYFAGLNEF